MKTLCIVRWNETFENADTRKRERLKFFHCPSGCDSNGYVELVTCHGSAGLVAFGVFQALCQLAATMPAKARGKFVKSNGSAMGLRQLALLIRVEICHLEESLVILMGEEIGWLKWVESKCESADDLPTICQPPPPPSAGDLPPAAGFVQGQGQGQGQEKSPQSPQSPPMAEEPWDAAPMPRAAAADRDKIEARINALDPLGGWWKRPHFSRTQREELDANLRIFADLSESDWCLLWRFCDAVIPDEWGKFWRPDNRGRLVQDIHDVLGHADRWVSECKMRKIEPAIPKEFPWPADYKSPADLLAEEVAAQRAIANETPAQAAQRLRDREKAERRATAKLNGKP